MAFFVLRRALLLALRVRVVYSPDTLDALHSEACIVTCNHVSLVDGIIVALAAPLPMAFAVDTDWARRATVAATGLRVLSWLGLGRVVPLDARAPYGMRSLMRELLAGHSVMVFPEGEISFNGQRGSDRPGVTWLQDRTGATNVTLRIEGAERSRLFAKSGREWWPPIRLEF
ncbi:1-acyl-sn-glycerol-3-phosphate acyltransferase [Paraburkholderia sp. J8-2]|uniref:1-acyl-sn-glycerol-3-phosphate acyltransferase n=1 Tax=Paraburkholderia sp. J8-2 TaxID=2805440 RepID=UPI002AB5E04D|nr:1-acyl-sn-glycerol-3-phosphate acyltransferase [Paraburkholderia sp. J8-2]